MSVMSFSVSAPGKVILHGEHAVVYNKTALAASLDLRTTLLFRTGVSDAINLSLPCIGLTHCYDVTELRDFLLFGNEALLNGVDRKTFNFEKPNLINFPRLMERVKVFMQKLAEKANLTPTQENALLSFFCLITGMFSCVTVPLETFSIDVTTDLTLESGMGSSASFAVCLSAALLQFIRCKASVGGNFRNISRNGFKDFTFWNSDLHTFDAREKELISMWSYLSDRIMHGNPSGIDNSVCTFGSIIQFRKGKDGSADIQMIPDSKILKVLLVHTGVTRDTGKMVKVAATRRERHPVVVDHILGAIDEVTVSASDVLRQLVAIPLGEEVNMKMDKLGELVDINQSLLQALGVSHPTLESICSVVQSHGLHGKLTGAGGGGYAYVLLPPTVVPPAIDCLKSELQSRGFTCQEVALGGPGVLLHNVSY